MAQTAGQASKPWWKSKWAKAVAFGIFTLLTALLAANIGGFLLFLAVMIVFPLIGIFWLIGKDKRRFPIVVWIAYTWWWIIGSLFYGAFNVSAESFELGWLAKILIGAEIPRLITSAAIGFVFALLITGLPIFLMATVAAKWVLALTRTYAVTNGQAIKLMIALILKINQPIWIVENGEHKEAEPKGWPSRIGGPGLVIIRPYNAVVFEQAGRVTRIEGPGEVRMNLDERIKEAVDLRLQSAGFDAEHVLTNDRVSLRVKGGAAFRVQRVEDLIADDPHLSRLPKRTWQSFTFPIAGRDASRNPQDDSRVHPKSAFNAVYVPKTGQKWVERVQGDAESEVRKVIRTYNFAEIYNLDAQPEPQVRETVLDEITEKVVERLRATARRYGVRALGASLKTIEIEDIEHVGKAYFMALGAEWRKRTAITDAEAEDQAFASRAMIQQRLILNLSNVMQKLRDALVEQSRTGAAISDEVINRYLQVSERILQNVVTDHATARRYLETLETLARVSPNTIIAAGMDVAHLADFITPELKQPGEDESKVPKKSQP